MGRGGIRKCCSHILLIFSSTIEPIMCRELRKPEAIVIQSSPADPQGLQDDLLAAQQAMDARGRNNLPVARYLQDSELLFESLEGCSLVRTAVKWRFFLILQPLGISQ